MHSAVVPTYCPKGTGRWVPWLVKYLIIEHCVSLTRQAIYGMYCEELQNGVAHNIPKVQHPTPTI